MFELDITNNITPDEYQKEVIHIANANGEVNVNKDILVFLSGLVEEVGELVDIVVDNIDFNLEDPNQVLLITYLKEFGDLAENLSILKRIFRGDASAKSVRPGFPAQNFVRTGVQHSQILSPINISAETKLEITKESGDGIAYQTLLANCFGITLKDIMATNLSKLKTRIKSGNLRGKGGDR